MGIKKGPELFYLLVWSLVSYVFASCYALWASQDRSPGGFVVISNSPLEFNGCVWFLQ